MSKDAGRWLILHAPNYVVKHVAELAESKAGTEELRAVLASVAKERTELRGKLKERGARCRCCGGFAQPAECSTCASGEHGYPGCKTQPDPQAAIRKVIEENVDEAVEMVWNAHKDRDELRAEVEKLKAGKPTCAECCFVVTIACETCGAKKP
ncbi:hypothetical protein LCGC14_0274190 [marine sediment metagenome]|uniref:Uncharacterized protein n=2 Tax=root TaxID=1 RepID=A0A9C9NEH2_9HYPH|nr:hypothetical protein [Aurantimonas coralicida]